jgi:hypothetical protein
MTTTNTEKQNADGMLRQNIDLETVSYYHTILSVQTLTKSAT